MVSLIPIIPRTKTRAPAMARGHEQRVLLEPVVAEGADPGGNIAKCHADCDTDSQCADGLYCFQREPGQNADDTPPGCEAAAGKIPNEWDICYDPRDNFDFWLVNRGADISWLLCREREYVLHALNVAFCAKVI